MPSPAPGGTQVRAVNTSVNVGTRPLVIQRVGSVYVCLVTMEIGVSSSVRIIDLV